MSVKYINTLKRFFEAANVGQLTIYLPDSQEIVFSGDSSGPQCDLRINDWVVMSMIAKRGDIGLGEAYHLGFWDSSDVAEFLTYCSFNLGNIKI